MSLPFGHPAARLQQRNRFENAEYRGRRRRRQHLGQPALERLPRFEKKFMLIVVE
jgi:hypothetical protein